MVDTVLEACRISPNSSTSRYEDIICYGLGSFGTDRQACSQLGLLIALKERTGTTRVLGYDPLWNSLELAALRALGCELIKSNECGRRTVERATLFFMPHCCLQLYDNLLWANWSPESLGNLSIIGNSIDGYDLRLGRKFQEKAWFMSTIHKSCIERSIDNKFEPEVRLLVALAQVDVHEQGVFNDLSFHEFPEQKMAKVSCVFPMGTQIVHVAAPRRGLETSACSIH